MPLQLKPINRTDRATGRLNAALNIYRNTILPEAQNPEKQIIYWIAHSKDELADQFRCFAIQQGATVVGYLQYSFFNEENLFFFEYLCIKDAVRNGLVPSEALSAIEIYLSEHYRPEFTVVFEIARVRENEKDWKQDQRLLRYFKRLGFRTIDFDYRYPVLQTYDGRMSYPADLMVKVPGNRRTVTATELRTILRCIYFKHYLRWDRPFLDPLCFAERERLINELYNSQVSRIDPTDRFDTKGYDNRSNLPRFQKAAPHLKSLAERLFGPKFFRVVVSLGMVTGLEHLQTNDWLLIPDFLIGLMFFSAAEDTADARKMLVALINKITAFRPGK